MSNETKAHSWVDALTTPVGLVSCALVSAQPLIIEGDDHAVTAPGAISVRRTVFDLPRNWNHDMGSTAHEIDGGRCWRWYFDCQSVTDQVLKLRCGLKDRSSASWDAVTGENLAAIEYIQQETSLLIGTEDDDSLYTRTLSPAGLFPARFKDLLALPTAFSDGLITLDHSGVVIHLPTLRQGERLYFHLIAAYKHIKQREDISTFTAVDRSKLELDRWQLSKEAE